MMVHARQSVSKHICIYYCHTKVFLLCFSFQIKEIPCWKLCWNNKKSVLQSAGKQKLSSDFFWPRALPPVISVSLPVGDEAGKSGPESCEGLLSMRMLTPLAAQAGWQAGRRKGVRRREAQLKASWTTAAQLLFCHRQVLWTKGFMGSFHPHMPHLHTLAPPDVVVLSSSTWHQLFPEHIQCFLAVCVQTSQIPKIVYRKMSSGRLIILYSNRAL